MISAPAASVARRVSSKDLYLPEPTMSRERYSFPASTNGSVCISPASDEMDDLDGVAVVERSRAVGRARNHGAVQLDGDAARSEAERRHEIGHGAAVRQLARLVVHRHAH